MSIKAKVIGGVLCGVLLQTAAYAEDTDVTDTFSLRLSKALAPERFFMRAGAIAVKVKSKSGDTYDVTGPVATLGDLDRLVGPDGAASIEASILARDPVGGSRRWDNRAPGTVAAKIGELLSTNTGTVSVTQVTNKMRELGIEELGTPAGIKGVAAENAATGGISLGYYLGDDYSWLVEAYVLAKPVETSVAAAGAPTYRETVVGEPASLQPFGLNGQTIVNTKLLPPLVMLGRYWGAKDAKIRFYTGGIAMYAIFLDSKATDALNNFVGGSVPGATTVSLKNAFGMGPMVGAKMQINDDWHVSFNVGSVKLKTVGTLVTRNTFITKNTGALNEYGRSLSQGAEGGSITDTLNTAEDIFDPQGTFSTAVVRDEVDKLGGVTGVAMGALAYNRCVSRNPTDSSSCNSSASDLGTYTRKTKVTLQNTMFMLSVGRNF